MAETSINDSQDTRGTPEQQLEAKFAALEASFQARLDAAVDAGIERALQSFTIQNGQGVVISGAGRNITVGLQNIAPKTDQQTQDAQSELPDGDPGDMLYFDADGELALLLNPGTPSVNDWVLRHDGDAPYWEEPGC